MASLISQADVSRLPRRFSASHDLTLGQRMASIRNRLIKGWRRSQRPRPATAAAATTAPISTSPKRENQTFLANDPSQDSSPGQLLQMPRAAQNEYVDLPVVRVGHDDDQDVGWEEDEADESSKNVQEAEESWNDEQLVQPLQTYAAPPIPAPRSLKKTFANPGQQPRPTLEEEEEEKEEMTNKGRSSNWFFLDPKTLIIMTFRSCPGQH